MNSFTINGGKMLRVGCKGLTRKNPGRKRCGGEGREIEKRRGTLGICGVAVLRCWAFFHAVLR